MVRYSAKLSLMVLFSLVGLGFGPTLAHADSANDSFFQESKGTTIMGREMSGTLTAGTPQDLNQLQTAASTSVLGKILTPVQVFINPPMTIGGTTYAEFYSFGSRVFQGQAYYAHDGIMSMTAGLLPTEVRVPIFAYPVGPLVLQVEGGVRAQANIEAKLTPTIMFPASASVLEAQLIANASAAGFVEGSAKLLFVRGGVGGELSLVDAKASVDSLFFFDGRKPASNISAYARFIQGKIYSFLDMLNIFVFGWSRMWETDYYKSQGYCVTKGYLACPAY
jgi:hypothetical protein